MFVQREQFETRAEALAFQRGLGYLPSFHDMVSCCGPICEPQADHTWAVYVHNWNSTEEGFCPACGAGREEGEEDEVPGEGGTEVKAPKPADQFCLPHYAVQIWNPGLGWVEHTHGEELGEAKRVVENLRRNPAAWVTPSARHRVRVLNQWNGRSLYYEFIPGERA